MKIFMIFYQQYGIKSNKTGIKRKIQNYLYRSIKSIKRFSFNDMIETVKNEYGNQI